MFLNVIFLCLSMPLGYFFQVLYFALSFDLQGEYLKAIKKETISRSFSTIVPLFIRLSELWKSYKYMH